MNGKPGDVEYEMATLYESINEVAENTRRVRGDRYAALISYMFNVAMLVRMSTMMERRGVPQPVVDMMVKITTANFATFHAVGKYEDRDIEEFSGVVNSLISSVIAAERRIEKKEG